MKKLIYSTKLAPLVFISPFLITLLVFWIFPVGRSAIMSFQRILPGQTEWVGLSNYQRLFNDRIFRIAIGNSFEFTAWMLILLILIPISLACLMGSGIVRHTAMFKTMYFVPVLVSVVVAGTIFRLIFSENSDALMNSFVGLFGCDPMKWLRKRPTGFVALLTLACWRWIGVNTMYYIAGLQNIPQDLYESASIDGANGWQKFTRISIPLLKPTTLYILTISINAGLSMFIESYIIYKSNNSPDNIGLTIVGYLYRQGIEKNAMGYACAVGLLLLVSILVINLAQLYFSGFFKKEEH